MSVAKDNESPIIEQLNGPSDLLPRIEAFADLSSGTEFASYKNPQWQFLLGGQEITAFALRSSNENDNRPDSIAFDGCVLRVKLDNDTVGFGMVLVEPSKRGRGFARLLIEKAMQVNSDEEGKGKRFVLAVCSSLGRPLYNKLGFKDAGLVTLLTCSVSNLLLKTKHGHWGNECLLVNNGKECKGDKRNLLVRLDAKATGFERRERINLLLSGYAEGSRATVAFFSTDDGPDSFSAAVARQDCPEGPLIIGPMMGREECCIPLLWALVKKHFEDNNREQIGVKSVMIMITDHPNLVSALMKIEGMNKLWQCPAMTSDGNPVYQYGDGSYLAMMHPTLG